MIHKSLYKVMTTLNQKSLRERVMVGLMLLVAVVVIWDLFIYESQSAALQSKQDEIDLMKQQVVFYQEQKNKIQSLLEDETTQQMMIKHQSTMEKIKQLDEKISGHQQQIISPSQLSTLLYSMLSNVKNVSIAKFGSLEKASSNSKEASQDELSAANVMLQQYELVLLGNFFGIKAYLHYLEKLKWQIYWEKMVYKVIKHPNAQVTLYFYTLSAKDA